MKLHACSSRYAGSARAPLAAMLLLAAAAAAPPPAAALDHPLIRAHASLVEPGVGGRPVDFDMFVVTTGYTQGFIVDGIRLESEFGWFFHPTVAQASPPQLAALRSALEVNHVGLHVGVCGLMQSLIIEGTYELTWYGAGLRRSDLTVLVGNAPSDTPPCPAEVCQVLRAVDAYAAEVLQGPSPFLSACPAAAP